MRWTRLGLIALALGLACAPAWGDEKKDKKDKKDAPSKPESKGPSLAHIGELRGEIVKISDGGMTFTLKVAGAVPVWIPGNPANFYARRLPFQNFQANRGTYTTRIEYTEYEITLAENVKIRVPPKPETDENGRVKPARFKKDPTDPDQRLFPGTHKGEATDLTRGMMVAVALGATKNAKNPEIFGTVVIVVSEKVGS